jgi:hypothetical protein
MTIAGNIELLKETLQKPQKIRISKYDQNVRWYYKYDKARKSSARYLLVSVKYLNGDGFIITAFYTRKIQ